jgi:GT2 family glycosyltransferase
MTIQPPHGFRLASLAATRGVDTVPIRVSHPDPGLAVSLEPIAPLEPGWRRLRLLFPAEGLVDPAVQFTYRGGVEFWRRVPAIDRNQFESTFRIDPGLERITIHLQGSARLEWTSVEFTRVGSMAWLRTLGQRAIDVFSREGPKAFARKFAANAVRFAFYLTSPGTLVVTRGSLSARGEDLYTTWTRVFDERPQEHRARHQERQSTLDRRPLISVVVDRLDANLQQQIYPAWELVPAANLKSAKGEYVLLGSRDTRLRAHALLELALTLNRYPLADLVYWDEDYLGTDGVRHDPLFKPAWAPDYFLSFDYIGPLLVRRARLVEIAGLEPSSDAALTLRLATSVAPSSIVHIAKVLSHRDRAAMAERPALRERDITPIARALFPGCSIALDSEPPLPRITHPLPNPAPLVSLIISTRDRADLLENCIASIRSHTAYSPVEIIIVDNDSKEPATRRLFKRLAADQNIRIVPSPGRFNYSALNNLGARQAKGTVLGLLNNDIEAVDPGWLTEMVSHALRPDIGCVGAKLLYPDGRIQHAGVYIGVGGVAGHGFRFADRQAPGYMNRLRTVQDVSAVTAACLLIRKNVFEEVGGLDADHLTVTLNDVDLCLKVRNAGYRNIWTPFAELIHHESVSRGQDYSREKVTRLAGELEMFRQRWAANLFNDPYYSPNLSYDDEDFSVRRR